MEKSKPTYNLEKELQKEGLVFVAGVDEAGMSPLAGPTVSAAVMFKSNPVIKGINDSKQLTPEQREDLFPQIIDKCLSYGIGSASVDEIYELNIYHANHLSMQRAIQQLNPQPDYILIDGQAFHTISLIPTTWVVKGDTKIISIAAASILAKVTRDRIMCKLAEEYPEYMWQQNKGYGVKSHLQAIKDHGITPYHRVNFKGVKEYINESI